MSKTPQSKKTKPKKRSLAPNDGNKSQSNESFQWQFSKQFHSIFTGMLAAAAKPAAMWFMLPF